MTQFSSRTSRFDIRIPSHVRETVEMAASLEGRSFTDFQIAAMLEKAEKVISTHTRIELTLKDQAALAEVLRTQSCEEPTEFMKRIASEYWDRVKSV